MPGRTENNINNLGLTSSASCLSELIEMLSDAKAMCQQTDTHCERNTNANIIDHRVREKETRDTNTLDYTSPSTLNGDSTITHW